MSEDRLSISYFIALLICFYFLLIAIRAAHEPQYSMFLYGRIQEIVFLRQWTILIGPFVSLTFLALGYYIEPWQIPLSFLGWLTAFYSVYSLVKDITGAWLRPVQRERYFLLEITGSETGASNSDRLPVTPPEGFCVMSSRWRGRALCVPVTTDWDELHGFLISANVNSALQDAASDLSSRMVIRRPKAYKLPKPLEHFRETALIHMRAKGGLLHNESKIRLCSDPAKLLEMKTRGAVEIQRTSYYFSVCSNELTRFQIFGRDAPTRVGYDLFNFVRRESSHILIDLESSELSNHIGGATLAITPTGKLLMSKQGRLNLVSAGLLASSGAGSFDWKDQDKSPLNFGELIRRGLERELMEECGFSPRDIKKTIVLGMGRDLSRGGKPEFFGVTLLARSEDLTQPNVSAAEVGFVDFHDHLELDLSTPDQLKERLNEWLDRNRQRCSTTLVINLKLLMNASEQVHQEIFSHLNGA